MFMHQPARRIAVPSRLDASLEWLETDGLGGFAMGTATGVRTRRYHSLLSASLGSPTHRAAFVKGVDAWIETPEGTWGLSSQQYAGGYVAPDGADHLVDFSHEPWPTWTFRLPSGLMVVHELLVKRGSPLVALSWRLVGWAPYARLAIRPLLACTDLHTHHHENPAFRFDATIQSSTCQSSTCLSWQAYDHVPAIFAAAANDSYIHDAVWYRGLEHSEEGSRGFDALEDLGSPGCFRWDIVEDEAVLLLSVGEVAETNPRNAASPIERIRGIRDSERDRRAALTTSLHRAADAYIVERGQGKTIVAGYPWFGDWGRDTFIAMRGLCLAGGRLTDAKSILREWADATSEGLVPNRFADAGDAPEYNTVDASLWFIVAAGEHLDACDAWTRNDRHEDHQKIGEAMLRILEAYARGTRYAIRACDDGLLAAGEHGQQLTWMDARVDGREVTPRIGKPVEIQALWINALEYGSRLDARWASVKAQAMASFAERFWNEERGCLFDVVDVDHSPGAIDKSLRPNQVLAVGGLPLSIVEPGRARQIVETIERTLLTPLGLRTLAPGEPGYCPRYEGGSRERDGAYHQGTVWPWLMGPFIEAWLRVHGPTSANARTARERFIAPLLGHLREGGLGHVSEIFDAEPPRLSRGCPFQAWSVGELLRITCLLDRMEATVESTTRIAIGVASS
jgi:predicted glycogen debranching enzyme